MHAIHQMVYICPKFTKHPKLMTDLFDKVSTMRLVGSVRKEVVKTRPDVSPNTIYLALKDTRPSEYRTALRNYIIEVAARILAAKEEEIAAMAEIRSAAQAA